MKIRSQVGMVLNLDKCIGCHTCSVTCKNVWTGREGMEYAWFNNVETKPGIGYPKNWEDQEEWQGGWVRDVNYSAAIFLIPICISFDTAEKRRYATYLILNRRFSFEF